MTDLSVFCQPKEETSLSARRKEHGNFFYTKKICLCRECRLKYVEEYDKRYGALEFDHTFQLDEQLNYNMHLVWIGSSTLNFADLQKIFPTIKFQLVPHDESEEFSSNSNQSAASNMDSRHFRVFTAKCRFLCKFCNKAWTSKKGGVKIDIQLRNSNVELQHARTPAEARRTLYCTLRYRLFRQKCAVCHTKSTTANNKQSGGERQGGHAGGGGVTSMSNIGDVAGDDGDLFVVSQWYPEEVVRTIRSLTRALLKFGVSKRWPMCSSESAQNIRNKIQSSPNSSSRIQKTQNSSNNKNNNDSSNRILVYKPLLSSSTVLSGCTDTSMCNSPDKSNSSSLRLSVASASAGSNSVSCSRTNLARKSLYHGRHKRSLCEQCCYARRPASKSVSTQQVWRQSGEGNGSGEESRDDNEGGNGGGGPSRIPRNQRHQSEPSEAGECINFSQTWQYGTARGGEGTTKTMFDWVGIRNEDFKLQCVPIDTPIPIANPTPNSALTLSPPFPGQSFDLGIHCMVAKPASPPITTTTTDYNEASNTFCDDVLNSGNNTAHSAALPAQLTFSNTREI